MTSFVAFMFRHRGLENGALKMELLNRVAVITGGSGGIGGKGEQAAEGD